MQTVLLVVHLIIALALIGVVLMQRSEGGALGIGGGGGGGNLFTARGVGNALTRTTAYLAIGFFLTSIALTLMATRHGTGGSVFDTATPGQTAPATGGSGTGTGGTGGSVVPDLGGTPKVPVSQ